MTRSAPTHPEIEPCGASYVVGPSHEPYGTSCDQAPGHYPATPHEGPHPLATSDYPARVQWRGGGSCAGDPLPYRDVRELPPETVYELRDGRQVTAERVADEPERCGKCGELLGDEPRAEVVIYVNEPDVPLRDVPAVIHAGCFDPETMEVA